MVYALGTEHTHTSITEKPTKTRLSFSFSPCQDLGDKTLIDDAKEAEIVVQALRLNTLSKLTFSDSIRFDSLIKDVFPGVMFNNAGYEELKVAIRESCVELGLNVNENQGSLYIRLGLGLWGDYNW